MTVFDVIVHHAPLIGLLFFFTFFVGMAAWVYRPGAKAKYQSFASIPFEENKDE
jgi:cbb3-type cytochrome oxidase subunit 3